MPIPATMTATVLVAPHRFELAERPVPTPGDEDVLVRVRACGV
jgi:D-arabinose 1-dehydrogenase-like Zn-dependent alcohol dehydrogenase